ncbi:MAG: YiiX/YebB-like N1pC/P60 family cysteine hydrolase [Verrucomicrobiales bacterium]
MIRLLPESRWAWIRAGVIVSALVAVCAYRNVFALVQLLSYQPREGDIVFQSLPREELVDAIEGITQSPWSHCGIIRETNEGFVVVEAIGKVRETPLSQWVMRGRKGCFEAYRLAVPWPGDRSVFLTALDRYMGRPYDIHYEPDDSEIYCSELVYKAFYDGLGLGLAEWQPLGALNWQPFEKFIRVMEDGALPLERSMITPDALARSKHLKRVYPDAH